MITLIGLGAGDADGLSRGAERALREASDLHRRGAGILFLRTEMHPTVDTLRDWGLQFKTFDALYNSLPTFTEVYAQIARRITEEAARNPLFAVAYAVPGHPLFGEDSVRQIQDSAKTHGWEIRVVSSGSFVEACLTAVGASLGDGCDIRDALTLTLRDEVGPAGERVQARIDVTRALLLFQVFDTASASHAKLCLMRDYPDDWEISLICRAGILGQEQVLRIPLFRLDREPVDYLTSVYIPPLPPALRRPTFVELAGIMARLRAPDGCPWDREQTHQTLKRFFIEETYEVIEAIDEVNPDLLTEELGDALLQVVFHAQLAAEAGDFTVDDVTASIVEKLVRRHPHVFGTVAVSDSDEVLRNWEQIKRQEKAETDPNWRKSSLDGVPKGLPALMQAMEISKRAVKVGFEWRNFDDVIAKLEEELTEFKAELKAGSAASPAAAEEMGDLLFTIVQVARWQKIDPEDALRSMLGRFSRRFRHMESRAEAQGKALSELTLEQMDALWEEAKRSGSREA